MSKLYYILSFGLLLALIIFNNDAHALKAEYPDSHSIKNTFVIVNDSTDSIASEVTIYPNPVTDNELNVKSHPDDLILNVEITSPKGALVLKQPYDKLEEVALDISALTPGSYIILIFTEHNTTQLHFMKQ